ncbi:MAG: zinc-binding dehydrogenase, partial [Acidimicrobiales bacterium]
VVAAKHPRQAALATELGATEAVGPGGLSRAVRRVTGAMAVGDGRIDRLAGGSDAVVDCVGSAQSLAQALAVVRPGGQVIMVGMPATVVIDLTPLWQREVRLQGSYAYGREPSSPGRRRTFELAFDLVTDARLGRMVSATYPLARYREALAHAAQAGRRGAVKVAFDLRGERDRERL